MARPIKQGLDYFPVDVDFYSDIKVRRVKKDCGPASISVLLCLLCNIYRDGYCIWLNEDIPFVIAEVTGVTEGAVLEIINKATQVGFFHEGLKSQCGILTSAGIQRRYLSVVMSSRLKRDGIPLEHNLIENPEELSKSAEESAESAEESAKSSAESTQSKAKQSKVKNKDSIALFYETVWKAYPNKKGKAAVSDTQKAKLFKIGEETILLCVERYKQDKPDWRTNKFIQHGSTFFNSGYVDYLDENYTATPAEPKNGTVGEDGRIYNNGRWVLG